MNDLKELTLKDEFNEFLGYTEEEIAKYFKPYIEEAEERLKLSEEEFWEKIRGWYNGYSWNGRTRVYNPFSILNFFDNFSFRNYWYESGSPSFLINYIEKEGLEELSEFRVDKVLLSANEIENSLLPVFLWQGGYLTITGIDEDTVTFDFPNYEVKTSFSKFLVNEYTEGFVTFRDSLRECFTEDDWQGMIDEVNRVIGSMAYHLLKKFDREQYWHILLYIIFKSAFEEVTAEELTSRGRSDLVIRHKDKVLVVEIKLDRPAKEALEQIKERGYSEKYEYAVLMGLSIDSKKRKITEWVAE